MEREGWDVNLWEKNKGEIKEKINKKRRRMKLRKRNIKL